MPLTHLRILPRTRGLVTLLLALGTPWGSTIAAQQTPDSATARDSATRASQRPLWRDKVRYHGGPSLGSPPSNFDGKTPVTEWCLRNAGVDTGRVARWLPSWVGMTRNVLSSKLSIAADSIIEVTDEQVCRHASAAINRDLLGWSVGGPPVVMFRAGARLVAFPSNARMGEFGFAVYMDPDLNIKMVTTW